MEQPPNARSQAAHHAEAGVRLARQGQWNEAEVELRKALDFDPGRFDAMQNLGVILLRRHQAAEAVHYLKQAEAMRPQAAEIHDMLGAAYAQLGRLDDAVVSLEKYVAMRPDNEAVVYRLVSLLFNMRQGAKAAAALEKLIAGRPELPFLYRMVANVLRSLGRIDEARAAVEQAIARDPGHGSDYYLLMDLMRFAPGDRRIGEMEALLARALPPQEQAELRFALAKGCRDTGDPARAFELTSEANRLMRGLTSYDERQVLGVMNDIKTVFTPNLMGRFSGNSDQAQAPIFILGMPRSGTTLVEQILASHPEVTGAGETEAARQAAGKLWPGFPSGMETLTEAGLHGFASAYLGGIGAAGRFSDKSLDNALYVGLLHLAFPDARFVWVVRDAVDTCLACYSRLFQKGVDYTYDLGELGRYYRAHEALMQHWQAVLPAGVLLRVQYENVVADVEGQAKALTAHCGLAWDDACLAFHSNPRPVFTASATQVRSPIYRDAIGRWRPSDERLKPLLDALGPHI